MIDHVFHPPEWAPQDAVWIGWPSDPDLWGDDLDGAQREIAAFAAALAPVAKVKLAVNGDAARRAAHIALGDRVDIISAPMGDIWLRDTGPICGLAPDRRRVGQCFSFNGWGGKYRLPGDTEVADAILANEHIDQQRWPFILEGGAIDVDGAGRLLTTRQCLLNPNRNRNWTEKDAETALKTAFGVDEILWLDDGLIGDHTDGHVDNLARFIGPGEVVCQCPSGSDDPNAQVLEAAETALRGAGLKVHAIPSPGRVADADGQVAPASHMNFVLCNGIAAAPVYGTQYDAQALDALRTALPQHRWVPLRANHVLTGGGAFHCCSQQIPSPVSANRS
ncbi:MAG: agmatine deiminase family protein [Pseudomonadota bacterium]